MDRWVSLLPDDRSITDMSIPGTHDSCAVLDKLFTFGYVRAQNLPIYGQLEKGIRYLDIRAGFQDHVLTAFHGDANLSYSLESVFELIYKFLNVTEHKKEVILVQIKQDHYFGNDAQNFANDVFNLIKKKRSYWSVKDKPLTLGDLRGKIQLVRRFNSPNNWTDPSPPSGDGSLTGIDVTDWPQNSTGSKTNSASVNYNIQDVYEPVPGSGDLFSNKMDAVKTHIQNAIGGASTTLYVNFVSGLPRNPGSGTIPVGDPKQVALGFRTYIPWKWNEGMNSRVLSHLKTLDEKKRIGVILLDFAAEPGELIGKVAAFNKK